MAGPLADFVVSLNTDGYIVSQGSVTDAIAKDATLAEEMKHEEEAVELDAIEETTGTQPAEEDKKGKLVVAEEVAIGHVSWSACEFIRIFTLLQSLTFLKTNYSSAVLAAAGLSCSGSNIWAQAASPKSSMC